MKRLLSLVMLAIVGVGCSETTLIRSYPPASKLSVNGKFIGLTPTRFTIPRSEFAGEFEVHVAHEGYTPIDGTLKKRVCPGRVVGGIFTLGVSLLFRGPRCFADVQDFNLAELPGRAATRPAVPGSGGQPTVEGRLQRLQQMRDDGTINQQEYEDYRQRILRDL